MHILKISTRGTRYGCLFTLTVLKLFNDVLNVGINDSLLTSSALQILKIRMIVDKEILSKHSRTQGLSQNLESFFPVHITSDMSVLIRRSGKFLIAACQRHSSSLSDAVCRLHVFWGRIGATEYHLSPI